MAQTNSDSPGFTTLLALTDLINQNITTLQETPTVASTFPNLDDPFTMASEGFRYSTPEVDEACKVIAGAALQIVSMVVSPMQSILLGSLAPMASITALRVCLEANVAEVLREAGPEGMHSNEIGEKTGLDGSKLGRLLRVLATTHIYREIRPNVFTNNRLSSIMDKGKSLVDIMNNPKAKHDGTMGLAAMLEFQLDEVFKSIPYVWESISTPIPPPQTSSPTPRMISSKELEQEAQEAQSSGGLAFNHAFKTQDSVWEWLERPGNEYNLKRFSLGMGAASKMLEGGRPVILDALDWTSFPAGSVLVDVGSGVGGMSLPLAEAHPHLNIVLQDRGPTLEEGKKMWKEKLPEAIKSDRVTFEVHDFFQPQTIKNPSVFLVKSILHDWDDEKCLIILKHLRQAVVVGANNKESSTTLIIIDTILPYACPSTSDTDTDTVVEGASTASAPEPLLSNGGVPGAMFNYASDIIMMSSLGGQERTLFHFRDLLKKAGWKMVKVVRQEQKKKTTFLNPIIAVPI